jgi:hypothetical protein
MSSFPRSAFVSLALASAIAPSLAIATTYAETLGVEQLIERSAQVVRGTVTKAEGQWTTGGYIETIVTIDVDEVYVGQAGDQVTVVAPGGTVEGQTMSVNGAPSFHVGDRVMVFADGRRIIGMGQGAFSISEDNVARRALGNELAHQPLVLDLERAFGKPEAARSCIDQSIDRKQADGWKLRGATGTRLGREDVAMWRVNLLADMEYKLDACADGLYDGARLILTDNEGHTLSSAEPGSETSLTFKPAETGVYFVGLYAEDLPEGVWRGAASVAIHYR